MEVIKQFLNKYKPKYESQIYNNTRRNWPTKHPLVNPIHCNNNIKWIYNYRKSV